MPFSTRVETSPLTKAWLCTTSRSQRRLVSMPSTRLRASASCIAATASCRVGAWTISLASMGSYQALTVEPAMHQVSARISAGKSTAVRVPVVGR